MTSTTQTATMLCPNGSHSLEIERSARFDSEPFAREEFYPWLEVSIPRAGTVWAQFAADNYVASSYDEKTNKSSPVWNGWRIVLRDVATPGDDPDRPWINGREPGGIGDVARRNIREACEPLIREWLSSDDYQASRQQAVRSAVVREIAAPRQYMIDRARDTLRSVGDAMDNDDREQLARALDLLTEAAATLDA
jgi:hypothetical protein